MQPPPRLEKQPPKTVLHPRASFEWGTIDDYPEFSIDARDAKGEKVDVHVVSFVDPDGERHLFAFSGEGKEKFLAAGRGGVVLATSIPRGNGATPS